MLSGNTQYYISSHELNLLPKLISHWKRLDFWVGWGIEEYKDEFKSIDIDSTEGFEICQHQFILFF